MSNKKKPGFIPTDDGKASLLHANRISQIFNALKKGYLRYIDNKKARVSYLFLQLEMEIIQKDRDTKTSSKIMMYCTRQALVNVEKNQRKY